MFGDQLRWLERLSTIHNSAANSQPNLHGKSKVSLTPECRYESCCSWYHPWLQSKELRSPRSTSPGLESKQRESIPEVQRGYLLCTTFLASSSSGLWPTCRQAIHNASPPRLRNQPPPGTVCTSTLESNLYPEHCSLSKLSQPSVQVLYLSSYCRCMWMGRCSLEARGNRQDEVRGKQIELR